MTATASVRSDDSCDLCDLPVPSTPITDEAVDGNYCCQGCLAVAKAIGDGAIEEFDDVNEETEEEAARRRTGSVVFLSIDGMHCTTCETFVRKRAASVPGINWIDVSYATETARVYFDDTQIDEAQVIEELSGYGYLAKTREAGDRGKERGDPLISFLVGGGLFGMMVMVWYAIFLYPTYFGMDPIVQPGGFEGFFIYANIWIFTSFVLFYTGWPILRGAVVSLLAGAPNMNLLVSIAALSAYAYSTLAMVLGRSDLYFDVSVAIILVVTAGTYYEGVVKRQAVGSLSIADVASEQTFRRVDGKAIPVDELTPGDTIIVQAGERIPFDGVVRSGTAAVDLSLLTGEAVPVSIAEGDEVAGGAIVLDNPLEVTISDPLESTQERLLDSMWTIQSSSSGVQRLADKLATIFVPLVLVVGSIVTLWTLVAGAQISTALLLGLTVLIVACPCALGLATPLGMAAGVKNGIDRGLIFVNAAVFETAPSIETIVFDKTGTLTDGNMEVLAIHGDDPDSIITVAADLEQYSSHPIATAIVDYAEEHAGWTPEPSAIATTTTESRGVRGEVDGKELVVGHPALFTAEALPAETIDQIRATGNVPVVVGTETDVFGVMSVGDTLRSAAREALSELATAHRIVVLTGDDSTAAELFREENAVDAVFSGVPPEGKVATIRRLQADGPVAMVGDGSNDAPALAESDLGIAIAEGTALAVDAADVIIAGDDFDAVVDLFSHVNGTNNRIKQNLGWAFVYNGIAIPLAITGLLNPFFAAIAMATSSILVVSNSARRIGP